MNHCRLVCEALKQQLQFFGNVGGLITLASLLNCTYSIQNRTMKIKQQSHERTQVRQVEQQAFGQELRKLSRKGRIAAADRLDRQTGPISRLRLYCA
ncbi:hypothetical protein T4D_7841 [Trichinella pseudospiralis]|uniref:Uncharacterized protein n=1 Tax=Trichinella pseudospiralis TaxID=6337 RepID=A0A0V1G4D6_TRIPS|nr:hypothetical protein T4D_7841 [Trichinella pseudospiralis]